MITLHRHTNKKNTFFGDNEISFKKNFITKIQISIKREPKRVPYITVLLRK